MDKGPEAKESDGDLGMTLKEYIEQNGNKPIEIQEDGTIRGTSLELVMSDFVYRWMMNEIISFWVEPAE